MSEATFWFFGHQITGHKLEGSLTMGYRKFRAFFGTSPEVCAILWNKLSEQRPQNSSPVHLLWGLMLLKQYQIESVNSTLVGVTEKTFRKWSMLYIGLLADLPVLDWESRFNNAPEDASTFVSLDGTDFRIQEQTPFDRKWYSHKFHGPGVRYEVGLCIRTGHIVWAHGGFPCGQWPDLKIARDAFVDCLRPGEKALADAGYRDNSFFENPNGDMLLKNVLARHETVNARIKQFCCMKNRFRHAIHLHPIFFHAVLHLTEIMIENGESLYAVDF